MSEVRATYLKGKRETAEFKYWTRWLDAVAMLANRFSQEVEGDDPLAYNETASVSLLTSAAACAGFVALAEFSTDKAAAKGERGHRHGRSDLWIQTSEKSWAFEFKQWNPKGASSPNGRLRSSMGKAEECARAILKKDADCAVAGVIWPLYWLKEQSTPNLEARVASAEERLSTFIENDCDYAWKVEGFDRAPPAYLLFKIVRDFARS